MDITGQRAGLYALISRIFLSEMDPDTLSAIEGMESFNTFFPDYSRWDIRNITDRKTLVERYLNVDYTDIAIMHLIPYESFYTTEEAMIETGGANPVVSVYNEYGYRVDLDRARVVSPDHIGVELEFMKILCEAQQKAEKAEDEKAAVDIKEIERGFLKDHLLRFAPMYLINVAEQARTPFYKDAAKVALEFLLEDYEYLSGR